MQPLATTTLRHLSRAHGCFDDINFIGLKLWPFREALSESRQAPIFLDVLSEISLGFF